MKALLLTEYKKMQVTDVAEPEVGAEDVPDSSRGVRDLRE